MLKKFLQLLIEIWCYFRIMIFIMKKIENSIQSVKDLDKKYIISKNFNIKSNYF